jgi:hypothetical protein
LLLGLFLVWILAAASDGLGALLEEYPWVSWVILATIGGGIAFGVSLNRKREVEAEYRARMAAIEQQYTRRLEEELTRLRSEEAQALLELGEGYRELGSALEAQAACIPDGRDVLRWWQEDLENLKQQILFRTALEPHLVDVRVLAGSEALGPGAVHLGNPLILCAPAELQGDRIPERLKLPDPWKHVKAKKLVEQEGRLELLNGVYYLETLLIGTDMLGTYGCFYDFISGLQVGERFSEQYYTDVVSLGWTADTLQLPLSYKPAAGEVISLEHVPTFTLSLSSGERFGMSIATQDYAREVLSLLRLGQGMEGGLSGGNLPSVEQAAMLLDTVLRVLRAQLRRHKRPLEEQAQDVSGFGAG